MNSKTEAAAQNRRVVEQFTRQAVPFSEAPALSNEAAFKLMVDASGVGPDDDMLDVACGPGLVAAAFAEHARRVVGIDLTPAMIERAKELQAQRGLANMEWHVGDVTRLPWPEASFSLVATRYSFHHLLDAPAVLAEMRRVCRTGGRVLMIDAAPAAPFQTAYNHMEKLRDPSHVHAFTEAELLAMVTAAGLRVLRTERYGLECPLEAVLAASFPNPGDAERIRELFREDLQTPRLGVNAHRRGSEIWLGYPTFLIAAVK